MSLSEKLSQNKLIKLGFNENMWIWFHILGGIVVAQVVYLFGGSFFQAMMTTLIIALTHEAVELELGMYKVLKQEVKRFNLKNYKPSVKFLFFTSCVRTYGTVEKWFYDSLGDILGTMIAAALSSLFLLGI